MERLKEIAHYCDESEIFDDPPTIARRLAKECGAVIVYGASDDLCELRGAMNDELGCYMGGIAWFTKEGLLENKCDCGEDCPYFEEKLRNATKLEIIQNDDETKPYFEYKINVPHEKFNVYDAEENLYCIGIVFYLKDCAG